MMMRALIVITGMSLSSAVYAAEPVREAGANDVAGAAYTARYDTRLNIIVRPDGGGLEADPDIGMPAMYPGEPEAPVAARRY